MWTPFHCGHRYLWISPFARQQGRGYPQIFLLGSAGAELASSVEDESTTRPQGMHTRTRQYSSPEYAQVSHADDHSYQEKEKPTVAQFVVDSDIIAAKSAQARSYVDSITTEVNGMTASLQDLQNSWTGSASVNFQGVLTNWRATQRQVEEAIAQINEALNKAGINYADTESANAAMFIG